jgi:hypothetical protein
MRINKKMMKIDNHKIITSKKYFSPQLVAAINMDGKL